MRVHLVEMRHVGHSGDRLGLPGSRDMFDSRLDALGAAAQTVGLERAYGRVAQPQRVAQNRVEVLRVNDPLLHE